MRARSAPDPFASMSNTADCGWPRIRICGHHVVRRGDRVGLFRVLSVVTRAIRQRALRPGVCGV